MAKRSLRLGIIGVGHVAQTNHLPALKKRRDAEVVAVCDDDADKVRLVAQHFGIPRTATDSEKLLRSDLLRTAWMFAVGALDLLW